MNESCMKRLKWRMRRIKDQYPRFFKGVADVLWLLFLLISFAFISLMFLMAFAGLGDFFAVFLLLGGLFYYISDFFWRLNHE